MTFDESEIARHLRRSRHEEILVLRQTHERNVRFIPAALIEQRGIGRHTRRHGDVVRGQVLECRLCIAPLDQEFAERREVEQRDTLSASAMLGPAPGVPVLLAEAIFDDRRDAIRCEDVRSLPAELRTEACIALAQRGVKRRSAQRPSRFELPVRPRHRVVQAEGFLDAVVQPGVIAVEASESADVDRP